LETTQNIFRADKKKAQQLNWAFNLVSLIY